MKLLLTDKNVIFDFGNDIVYAKIQDGSLVECEKNEASHILNREQNSAVMANQGFTLIQIDKIPDEVKTEEYKYENGEFVVNEDYIPYVSTEDRISALEDMVNMLLLNS